LDAFLSSTFLVAAAEMGDKSQLVALAFATRYSWKVTLAGVTVATLLVHLFSVALGEAAGAMLPTFWIQVAAGVAFIGFGLWTLRGDTYEESDVSRRAALGPFATVAMAFFLSELGDKTMLATVTLAAQLRAALGVWVGSTLGMVAADAVAVFAGIVMGKNLPQRAIKLGASVVFFVSGAYALAKALGVLA
jgi:putative Ca2+/H+ antiporter (TMEM165/GDT1 family)